MTRRVLPRSCTPRSRRLGVAVALGVVATLTVSACGGGGSDEATRPTTGAAIYKAYCLTCHGAQGQGFVGPKLAGLMVAKYPNVDDQIAVVANGTGRMPAFRGSLSATEIRRVVEYERTDLGQ